MTSGLVHRRLICLVVLVNNLTQDTDGYSTYASTTANGDDGWAPIGESFTGTFDGQGHTIDGLYINRTSTGDIGLFGIIGTGGEVRNHGVTNVNVTGAGLTGGLTDTNDGLIENSYTTGVVEGGQETGGLVGVNKKGTITNSYSGAEVISDDAEIGGLAGKNANIIKKSYSFSVVNYTGTGTTVGGLIGKNDGTTTDRFWDTEASGQPTSAGGTGKITSEMHDVATFTDTATGLSNSWDFHDNPNDDTGTIDIWNIAGSINDGYPYLTVPDLQTAETGDANGDGTVDTITATFTKSVDDSSVSTS